MFTSEGRNRTTGTVCDEKAGLVTTDQIGLTLGTHRLVFLTGFPKMPRWRPGGQLGSPGNQAPADDPSSTSHQTGAAVDIADGRGFGAEHVGLVGRPLQTQECFVISDGKKPSKSV